MLKADPYGNYAELRPNNASVVWDINQYQCCLLYTSDAADE